ncbi:MAG: hypothetical protein WKF41_19520, partial [Gaiellaceae bacterium]
VCGARGRRRYRNAPGAITYVDQALASASDGTRTMTGGSSSESEAGASCARAETIACTRKQ